MEFSELIQPVLTFLGGGFIAVYLNNKLANRKEGTNEFQVLVNEYKSIADGLNKRIDGLEDEIKVLRERENQQALEIVKLRNQLIIFESSAIDIPLPMWMKDKEGKMMFLNDHYEDAFLIPRGYTMNDYIGNDDTSVWSDEVAKEFIKNDKEVMRTKKYVRSMETLENVNGDKYLVEILKYPRLINRDVIGISGIVLKTYLPENNNDKSTNEDLNDSN